MTHAHDCACISNMFRRSVVYWHQENNVQICASKHLANLAHQFRQHLGDLDEHFPSDLSDLSVLWPASQEPSCDVAVQEALLPATWRQPRQFLHRPGWKTVGIHLETTGEKNPRRVPTLSGCSPMHSRCSPHTKCVAMKTNINQQYIYIYTI